MFPDPEIRSLSSDDLDETRLIIAEHFYANFVDQLTPGQPLATEMTVGHFGPVTVGEVAFGTDVRIKFDELGAYHVDLPVSGQLLWRQGGSGPLVATGACAAVFRPVGDTVLDRWTADCRLLAVKIERAALEERLAGMLDAPVRSPIPLDPRMDTTAGPGRAWARLVRLLAAEAGDGEGLVRHPALAEHLRETVLTGLLLATGHPYRERLTDLAGPDPAPRAVRRAVEAMRSCPERPFTLAGLAEIAQVSERALQRGFRRHLGMSPTAYLRQVRLARAHEELTRATPAETTVAEVAYRCGFVHLGRFAAAYREYYGVPPSRTLRGLI